MQKMEILFALAASLLFASCGKDHEHGASEHDHGSKGHEAHGGEHAHASPHGGIVKSVGDYHLELVTGDEGALTLHVLGTDEKSPHPIAAADLTAQVQEAGKPDFTAVTLSPSPVSSDGSGKCSRFTGTLPEELHGKVLTLTVSVSIEGKPYRGQFEVEGHGAAHEEHEEHEDHDC